MGINVVPLDRFQLAVERQGQAFLDRLFTDEERQYSLAQGRPSLHLAVRFAAKEAVSKALGIDLLTTRPREIEIVRGSGRPTVRLSGIVLELAKSSGVSDVQVSLTHTADVAVAVALALATP